MQKYTTCKSWLEENIDHIEAVVFDVDGVLVKGSHEVPGAPEIIAWLRERKIPFNLLTNDGCHAPQEKVVNLAKGGVNVDVSEIISCSHGLLEVVPEFGLTGMKCYVMGTLGEPSYGQLAGVDTTDNPEEISECAAIIVSEMKYDWHDAVGAAFNELVKRPDMPVIVPNPDDYFLAMPGVFGVGSGAIARFVQRLCACHGVNINPVFLGKPYQPIYAYSHHQFEKRMDHKINHERVLMLGDSLKSDIKGALEYGYNAGLVMTGITTPELLENSDIKPHLVFDKLA